MKAQLPPRLTQTKTGVYGYRRKIKKPHQRMFDGKTEIFKSFKTKDLRHALRMHKDMDRWYDDVLASNGYEMPLAENLAPRAKVVEVVKDLKNRSLHPTDIPKLDATASPASFNRFMESIAEALPLMVADSQGAITDEEMLEAFEELRKSGYQVTIYDRYDRPGGLLIYGIPNFKLEKFVVERRTKLLKETGIKFVQNFEAGKDKSLYELKEKHDAILIATGVYKAREIEIPGHNLQNIFPAMDFLTASNRKGLGDKVKLFDDGTLNAEGKNVVVIGGGDTAMDCVRTSIRQKAKSVKCIYRRDRENMPGSAREVGNAIEEGVEFVWLTSPKSFIGTNKVEAVEVNKMKLGEPDSSGRRRPELEAGSEYKIPADLVIKSLGFDPENLPKLFNAKELVVSQWGTLKIDLKSMQTNLDGVFAAGDIVRGASLVVWAIRDGRDAAVQIEKYLQLKANKNKSEVAA